MADTKQHLGTEDLPDDQQDTDEARPKLNLGIKIDKPSACQRHITVTIAREDIDRYYDEAFGELMDTAQVPGFRPGRAPRKLIETRFRKDVTDQIKGSLLLDSVTQVTDDSDLSPISEPDFDLEAIEVPPEGPMTFEFNLEVRPDFKLPNWKGLSVERPVRKFTKQDVDRHLEKLLSNRGRLIPHDGPAEVGDYITVNLTFKHDGQEISRHSEVSLRIRPVLSLRDSKIEGFDKLMKGVRAGETRETQAPLAENVANESLQGRKATAIFEVLEVKKLELPELTPQFLEELGGFKSDGELRDGIQEQLERQLEFQQKQRVREQVTAALTEAATWDLPPELLRRQSQRELSRSVMELQRSGFSEQDIRAHENELRRNSMAVTQRSLKEHFILERIAEEEKITDEEPDYNEEIRLIAAQSGQSPRRVRAHLEKENLMDVLRNQIIERKTIDLILSQARFTDVPFKMEASDTEAVDEAASHATSDEEIPEAKHAGEAGALRQPADHT